MGGTYFKAAAGPFLLQIGVSVGLHRSALCLCKLVCLTVLLADTAG